MVKTKIYPAIEHPEMLLADRHSRYGLRTYVSLFSSAGVGCYGFKEEGFYCVATVELLERRLKIQKFNQKCVYNSGYICGDMTTQETKDKVFAELGMWKRDFNLTDLDVLIATPPCQGMSVANHKKKDELKRNSLVVESIKMTQQIQPKFFIFENVRAFLSSVCTDVDGQDKSIKDAIEASLSGKYNILYQVVNFKDYGNPSSRTRTLVIGVRKDLKEVTPYDIFPDKQPEQTLRQVIGHLPSLKKMGEISENDIYHNFRKYSPRMESWIADIKEGQSAFDNTDITKIPHSVKNGVIVYNACKNGDKYTRQYWDKVAPCIHTRNDILASQNTVHPADNRVFSIREVMLMMSVPSSFNWSDISFEELNKLSVKEKEAFLKKEEMNIRQNLGEAVPTIIFKQIAAKIRRVLCKPSLTEQDIKNLIDKKKLTTHSCLVEYIRNNDYYGFAELSKIAELANAQREDNAAYYTRQDICYTIVKSLPEAKNYTELNILEPSIGVGNFLPTLILKYASVQSVNIDVVDIDANSIEIVKELVAKIDIPNNIHINYINADFLLYTFDKKYDIVVGNPPYKKLTKDKQLLAKYKIGVSNKDTNNIFSFFIEKAMRIGNVVSLIVPKSLINAPEFDTTRSLMKEKRISRIIDFGEKGFRGVKIETICFILDTQKKPQDTIVESYITDEIKRHPQAYLTDDKFPYWIIYRNEVFDEVADKMEFNVFKVYRDRVITKAITKNSGRIRVLKSRNIGNNEIVNIPDYDCYIDNITGLDVAKYLNQANCILLPNLTYNPRACFMPKGCIADGSVAILTLSNDDDTVTKEDLAFYATDSFTKFYAIARNLGTRSLNIDNNSVFFFWKAQTPNDMRNVINEYLSQFDLDIRKSHDARFVDQKCTPDIVCFMADCVMNLIATKPVFVINDVWDTQYFIQNTRVIFNKPWANDKKAYNEYNKVLSQPLKLLAYAHILNVKMVDGALTFSVANEDLLDYIARKDRNAYNFLYCYFMKVMSDSGFMKYFEEYAKDSIANPTSARNEIYDRYYRLINGNTPSHSRLDIRRMFHKVFNVYAAEHHLHGSNGKIAYYSDLMYNKKNWRDMNKDKTVTRQEAMSPDKLDKQEAINTYYVQKAIALIRKIHTVSEVNDSWGNGEATQVHHIFPRSQFPQIAHYVENLILLTATQHNTKAHPNNKTQQINKDYQLVCLLAKADTIENSLLRYGDKYYRKESFVYVINTGLETDFSIGLSFNDIKTKLIKLYNAA